MRACIYSGRVDYRGIEENLTLFVAPLQFVRDSVAIEAAREDWVFYVLDTEGMSPMDELSAIQDTAKLVRSFPNRCIVIWSNHTWERFKTVEEDAAYSANCLRCDIPGWVEKLTINIK